MSSAPEIIGAGRIGIHDPFVEGTPETRRAANEAHVRELRTAVARNRFFEVPPEHVERHGASGA
jgi:hypothetical protein